MKVPARPKRWKDLDDAIANVNFARGSYFWTARLNPNNEELPQLAATALDAEHTLAAARLAMVGDE